MYLYININIEIVCLLAYNKNNCGLAFKTYFNELLYLLSSVQNGCVEV